MDFDVVNLNDLYDDNALPVKTCAIRRRNDYLKAKRFRNILLANAAGYDNLLRDKIRCTPLGRFVKNTSFNDHRMYKGWNKTKNKGKNHRHTYAPSHNYCYSDIKKIIKMNNDLFEYFNYPDRSLLDGDYEIEMLYSW